MPVTHPPAETRQNRSVFGAGTVIVGLVSLFLVSAYWLFDHAGRSAALVAHTLDVKRATNELVAKQRKAFREKRRAKAVQDRT